VPAGEVRLPHLEVAVKERCGGDVERDKKKKGRFMQAEFWPSTSKKHPRRQESKTRRKGAADNSRSHNREGEAPGERRGETDERHPEPARERQEMLWPKFAGGLNRGRGVGTARGMGG